MENQIKERYRAFGDYYTKLTVSLNDKLYNWIFILNTGGVIIITPYMLDKKNLLFLIPISIFILGIITIFIAVLFERIRFIEKGKKLDEIHREYFNKIITQEYLEKNIPAKISFYDKASPIAEIISVLLFFIGLVASLIFSVIFL
ncbi:TPA: hypothetical protein I8010_002088 [Legionella pneumophila]|uniref:hypothetical protein n=1 Tax=Legionella pneumophila TaxID=446 RepID=UPI001A353922|nr:hypothetical protein [Legionella pneumophila]HAT1994251.1 hypothetical protein [Legionella pneumophila]HAT2051898.1 hypothetical protein [Legionella pneumophila]HAT2061300.1 hypothetical protein [Legionella pneumophila]HAT4435668.1 hypothetical protein [Legionella pneumophila]